MLINTSGNALFKPDPVYADRNKMVEYLTDWVMGTSNQAADDDIKCLTRYTIYIYKKKKAQKAPEAHSRS